MSSKLEKFLSDKMSMTEIYQPVIIRELLRNKGICSKTDLAVALSRYDLSILEYYRKIVMRWPKNTLTKHNIINYQRESETFELNLNLVDINNVNSELNVCETKIAAWFEKKKNKKSPQASESVRYKILKRAKGKCELCGCKHHPKPAAICRIVNLT